MNNWRDLTLATLSVAVIALSSQAGLASPNLHTETSSTSIPIKTTESPRGCQAGSEQINATTGKKQLCR